MHRCVEFHPESSASAAPSVVTVNKYATRWHCGRATLCEVTVTDLRVHAGSYDELLLPDGTARPHAHVLVETLRRLGVDELQARQDLSLIHI